MESGFSTGRACMRSRSRQAAFLLRKRSVPSSRIVRLLPSFLLNVCQRRLRGNLLVAGIRLIVLRMDYAAAAAAIHTRRRRGKATVMLLEKYTCLSHGSMSNSILYHRDMYSVQELGYPVQWPTLKCWAQSRSAVVEAAMGIEIDWRSHSLAFSEETNTFHVFQLNWPRTGLALLRRCALRSATCNLQPAICHLPSATCNLQSRAWFSTE